MAELLNRLDRVREELDRRGLDALIVTRWENIYYLTGIRPIQYFTKSHEPMPLIIHREGAHEPVFLPTEMFSMAARLEPAWLKEIRPYSEGRLWSLAQVILADWEARRVGIESRYLSSLHYEAMSREAKGMSLVDASDLVGSIAMVKSKEEIGYLREASRISDKVAKAMVDYLKPGLSEMDVARDIVRLIAEYGGEEPSFHPQVFSGRRAYLLNISSSYEKRLEAGEVVLLDFGVAYRGYKNDITRAYILGKPESKHLEVDRKVAEMVRAIISCIRPGLRACDIHSFALERFREIGYDGWCRHYTGHGLGLTMDRPMLVAEDDTELRDGMVLAIEQGLYFEDFGIRYEDDIIVTKDGVDDMTELPMELTQVG